MTVYRLQLLHWIPESQTWQPYNDSCIGKPPGKLTSAPAAQSAPGHEGNGMRFSVTVAPQPYPCSPQVVHKEPMVGSAREMDGVRSTEGQTPQRLPAHVIYTYPWVQRMLSLMIDPNQEAGSAALQRLKCETVIFEHALVPKGVKRIVQTWQELGCPPLCPTFPKELQEDQQLAKIFQAWVTPSHPMPARPPSKTESFQVSADAAVLQQTLRAGAPFVPKQPVVKPSLGGHLQQVQETLRRQLSAEEIAPRLQSAPWQQVVGHAVPIVSIESRPSVPVQSCGPIALYSQMCTQMCTYPWVQQVLELIIHKEQGQAALQQLQSIHIVSVLGLSKPIAEIERVWNLLGCPPLSCNMGRANEEIETLAQEFFLKVNARRIPTSQKSQTCNDSRIGMPPGAFTVASAAASGAPQAVSMQGMQPRPQVPAAAPALWSRSNIPTSQWDDSAEQPLKGVTSIKNEKVVPKQIDFEDVTDMEQRIINAVKALVD